MAEPTPPEAPPRSVDGPRPGPRVIFLHGLESGPNGDKVHALRAAGIDVVAPDMEMSLRRLDRRNSVVRNLLRLRESRAAAAFALTTGVLGGRRGWLAAGLGATAWIGVRGAALRRRALRRSYEACIAIQHAAILRDRPDVLLGSSWGGAVAVELVARGLWRGPTVLLAPAFHRVATGMGWKAVEADLAQLRALAAVRPVVVLHDPGDDTVPFADSVALAGRSAIELRPVDAGGHRLMGLLDDGSLAATLRRVAGG